MDKAKLVCHNNSNSSNNNNNNNNNSFVVECLDCALTSEIQGTLELK
jgi:hypothetical protein